MDDLLEAYDRGPVKIIGFADDATLIVRGKDPHVLVDLMEDAISKAVEWGCSAGLQFNASKTAVILFTRKNKVPDLRKVRVNGVGVDFVGETRYLGFIEDSKLNFNKHIIGKINKARGLLFKLRQVLGKHWGLSPEMAIWAFRSVVVPMITYGSIVWGVEAKRYAKEFEKLYRLAMVLSTFVMQSTQLHWALSWV